MALMEQIRTSAVLARIRAMEGRLTPSENAVAQVVLEQADAVVGLSVESLAEKAGVSTATVVRLCRTLGFGGFKDFKIALALERGSAEPAALRERIDPSDSLTQIARKVLHSEAQALRETLDLLDESSLRAAVDAFANAGTIAIFGMGSSTPLVVDAYYRFARLGLRVSTPPDSHMQAVTAALLRPDDAVLVISYTGRTHELLTATRQAKAAGATVVALTSFLRSPLLEHADVHLVTAVTETASRVEAMSSRTAHLGVIDTLYVALAMRLADGANEALERTQTAIDAQRTY